MTKRGEFLGRCVERDLCGDFAYDIADMIGDLEENQKDGYAEKINHLIDQYQTETEIREAAHEAGLLFIPEDCLTFDPKDEANEIKKRLKLLNRIMHKLGARPQGRLGEDNVKVYEYEGRYFYPRCKGISDNEITIQMMASKSLKQFKMISSDEISLTSVDEFYELVKRTFRLPHYEIASDKTRYNGEKINKEHIKGINTILANSANYIIGGEYETAYLIDKESGKQVYMDSFYGDPQLGLIDADERFCVTMGGEHMCIYFIDTQKTKTIEIPMEWGYYMLQDDTKIRLRIENHPEIIFDVYEIEDGVSLTDKETFDSMRSDKFY